MKPYLDLEAKIDIIFSNNAYGLIALLEECMFYIHVLNYIEKRLISKIFTITTLSLGKKIMGYFNFLPFAYPYFLLFQ